MNMKFFIGFHVDEVTLTIKTTVGDKVRYLRLHIDKGAAGLWEWKIY